MPVQKQISVTLVQGLHVPPELLPGFVHGPAHQAQGLQVHDTQGPQGPQGLSLVPAQAGVLAVQKRTWGSSTRRSSSICPPQAI